MSEASTRFAAAAHQRGDDLGEATVIWTTLVIALVPIMLGSLALLLGAEILVDHAFHLPAALRPAGIGALRIASLGFAARSLAGVLNTPQLVRLRMDLYTIVNSGCGILQIGLVPIVLAAGGGLSGAVWVITAAAVAMALAHAVVARRLLPELTRPRFRRDLFASLARFGAAVAATAIMTIALSNGEKLLLTRFASVKALAYYSVAFTFVGLLSIAPAALGQAMTPAFARLGSLQERAPLQQLYSRVLRAVLFWTVPVALLLCVVARPFFTVWAGPDFGRESTQPFYILAGGAVVNLIAFVPYRLLAAQGRVSFIARYHAIELIPYLVCAGALTYRFGATGAAAAWALRLTVGAAVFLLAALRLEGMIAAPVPANRRSYLAALAVLLAPVAMTLLFVPSRTIQIGIAIASIVGYAALIWARVLTTEERGWMGRLVAIPALSGRGIR